MSCVPVVTIIDKYYEHRTPEEHTQVVRFLQPHFPTLTPKMAKLISFYLRSLRGNQTCTHKQFTSQSFVITGIPETTSEENPQILTELHQISRNKSITIPEGTYAITLDYAHYLNCMALGQTSIEEEVSFMHSSEYLCSIPRKRFYQILRNSKALTFSISQVIYFEGQRIEPGESGSGVYFVRKGQFGYFKDSDHKNDQIQTLRFSKGHIFGTLQIQNQSQNNSQNYPTRKFTVKCKSHHGLVYNFAQEIFSSQIKPYCEAVINSRQNKLMKYLDNQLDTMNRTRGSNAPFLSQTLTRGFSMGNASQISSNQLPTLTRTRFSIPSAHIETNKLLKSQQIEEQGLKRSGNFSLSKDGPLKNYPLASQRSHFTDSEFRQFEKLNKNKVQCDRIRKLKAHETAASKGQILFSFFKNTWLFDKQKKLSSRRYQNNF